MKHIIYALALTIGLLPAIAVAHSGGTHDVARDNRFNVVTDARGGCVLTKWTSDHVGCITHKENTIVYFAFNSSKLSSKEKMELNHLVRDVQAFGQVVSATVVGYTDEIGSSAYNDKLSRRRAEAVRSYLSRAGVRTRDIEVRARGERRGDNACDSKSGNERIACLAEDRRVEIHLEIQR